MAVCYKYLGEKNLFYQAIDRGKQTNFEKTTLVIGDFIWLVQLADPRLLFAKEINAPVLENEDFDRLKETW